ncbi:MAG: putative porin [Bacteroidota bacterium]
MKYFFLLLFFLTLLPNKIFGSGSYRNSLSFQDTIKTKTTFKKDSLKTSTTDSTKIIQKEKFFPLKTISYNNYKEAYFTQRKEKLNYTDYRFTGDYFSQSPFGFVRDLGTIGQPNEMFIYGQGFNNLSFLSNGIDITNRLQNSFDLSLYQSESIDSIEVFSLPQGFLWSHNNNISTTNFVVKDFTTNRPYSRIKFYQAPNEEGMFDGIFSSNFGQRLSTLFEITNQSTDFRFSNSDYSLWIGSARMRYLLSNKVNISFSYVYSQTDQQLFGGVDADSIRNSYTPEQFNEVLFSPDAAPVRYSDRYQKIKNHNFSFGFSVQPFDNSFVELLLYSQSNLTEFRQNESKSSRSRTATIINNNRYETYGAKLQFVHSTLFINFLSVNLFEENKLRSLGNYTNRSLSDFSTANRFTFFPDSQFISASVFGKYLNYDGENNLGFGADGFINLTETIKVYGGFSSFEKPRSIFEFIPRIIIADDLMTDSPSIGKSKNTNLEFKLIFKSNLLNFSLGYFSQSQKDKLISAIVKQDSSKKDQAVYFDKKNLSLNGFNLNFNFRIWKLLISSNTNYYFNNNNRSEFGLPEFTSTGGLYYIDTLFKSNLKLKTGINYYSIGSRNQIYFDFEKGISTPYLVDNYYNSAVVNSFEYFSPEFQFDFFLAGEIQDRAIIYFVFENILNNQYFVVPYYPKQERGLRFGVAWEFLD